MIYCCFLKKEDDEHLVAYALLKYALAIKGITEYKVERKKNGKPYILGNEAFFSLAHTDGFCVLAMGKEPVGVDCENKKRELGELLKKRIFTENEINSGIPPIVLWTLKEAAAKLTGRGVAQMLEGIEFDVKTLTTTDNSCKGEVYYKSDYIIAVCEEKSLAHELIEVRRDELEMYIEGGKDYGI